MKHEDDTNCGNTNLNEDMIVAVVIANSPEKKIRAFNGIRTHGLCVSAAVKICNYLNCNYHSEAHNYLLLNL